jgi:hypothetical protein
MSWVSPVWEVVVGLEAELDLDIDLEFLPGACAAVGAGHRRYYMRSLQTQS